MNCSRRGLALAAVLAATLPAAHADVQLRVNQLGVAAGHPSRAWLMVDGGDVVEHVDVLDGDGAVVARARVAGAAKAWGAWSVSPLDVRPLPPGSYTLRACGSATASSPAFPVAERRALHAGAIANALAFYQAERDGPDFVPGPLRSAPGHLNDAAAAAYAAPVFDHDDNIVGPLQPTGATRDASGGWWDAGDYLKFVQTHSYTVGMLLTGVRDFPAQMGARSPASDFTAEARFGLEWLLRMWDDDTRTLYYQVGLGTGFEDANYVSDHDLWRLPEVDDTYGGDDPATQYIRHRPLLRAAPAGAPVSPNLAGRLAASFALGARVFAASDPAFAARCLRAAEHVYALADTHPKPPLVTTAPWDFYPESSWHDDMEWGATELALALRAAPRPPAGDLPVRSPATYLREASAWARLVIEQDAFGGDPLGLYDVAPLAHFDLQRALAVSPGVRGLRVSAAQLRSALVASLRVAARTGASDPFGFGTTWKDWDTTTRGVGLSVMASQVAHLTGDARAAALADAWMGNVLGANAWGLSLIVGDGASFPQCLQHQGGQPAGVAGRRRRGAGRRRGRGAERDAQHRRRPPVRLARLPRGRR